MKIYISKSKSPYINQSLEYQMLLNKEKNEDILFLWLNDNAIIIGRNQNIFNEVNEEFVKENNIRIARRHSGGGAVYHDLGNILFSIMTNKTDKHSYERFLEPIIKFLNELGVNAAFQGRNDVLVDGMKISGNAQFVLNNNLATHGTLLFNTDLSVLGKSLVTNKHKIETKGIQSNKMRVTNIKNHIKEQMNSEKFIQKLVNFFEQNGGGTICEIPNSILESSKEMSTSMQKYEWIYGRSPKATIENKAKFSGGHISVFLDIEEGKISNINICGDFLSLRDISEVYPALININFSVADIRAALQKINILEYFGTITLDELVQIISGESTNE